MLGTRTMVFSLQPAQAPLEVGQLSFFEQQRSVSRPQRDEAALRNHPPSLRSSQALQTPTEVLSTIVCVTRRPQRSWIWVVLGLVWPTKCCRFWESRSLITGTRLQRLKIGGNPASFSLRLSMRPMECADRDLEESLLCLHRAVRNRRVSLARSSIPAASM